MREKQYPAKGTGVQLLGTELHGTPERMGCHVIQPKAKNERGKNYGQKATDKNETAALHLIVKGSSWISVFYSTGN